MQRFERFTTSALTLAMLAGTAMGQLTINAPLGDGTTGFPAMNEEILGADSVIDVDIAAGEDGTSLADGQNISVRLVAIDAMGNELGINSNTLDLMTNYANAGGTNVTIDVSMIAGIDVFLNTVTGLMNFDALHLEFSTPGQTAPLRTAFDMADEANDQAFDTDLAVPVLEQVVLTDTNVFFIFSEPMNNGAAANDPNHTVAANLVAGGNIAAGAFQRAAAGDAMFGTPTQIVGANNPAFMAAGADNTIIRFDIQGGFNLAAGDLVRVTPMTTLVNDVVGNAASETVVVTAGTDEAPTITGAEWRMVVENGGAVNNALAVTFDQALDPADLGDADFYNDINFGDAMAIGTSDAMLTVTGVSLDAADTTNATVLLNVTDAANVGVFGDANDVRPDGLATGDPAGGMGNPEPGALYSILVDIMGANPPGNRLGTQFGSDMGTADDTQTVAITDAITPALNGGGGPTFAVEDVDGDGTPEFVTVFFNEPLRGMAGDLTNTGITVTSIDGVNVFPVDEVNPNTGERTMRTTVNSMMAAENMLTVGTPTLTPLPDADPADPFEQARGLRLPVNTLTFDFDHDGMAGAAADADEPTPGSDLPAAWANVSIDMTTTVVDANGNAPAMGAFPIAGNLANDLVSPILRGVAFIDGESVMGGNFLPTEVGGLADVGAQQNNDTGLFIFSEPIDLTGAFAPQNIQHGVGDFFDPAANGVAGAGAASNTLLVTDNPVSGFDVDDMVSVGPNNGIVDESPFDNEFAGTAGVTFTAADGTPPYIPLQRDVNGNAVLDAVTIDSNDDGLIDLIELNFVSAEGGIDPTTIETGAGADQFTINGQAVTAALDPTNNTQIELTLPAGLNLPAGAPVMISYNADTTSPLLADGNGNVLSNVTTTITAQMIAEPNIEAEFAAVSQIRGNVNRGGTPLGGGTAVYGGVALPLVKSAIVRGTGVRTPVFDDASALAINNFLYGLCPDLFIVDANGSFTFTNDVPGVGAGTRTGRVAIDSTNRAALSWTTTLVPVSSSPSAGIAIFGEFNTDWEILGSTGAGNGTAVSLYENGFGWTPLFSSTVTTDGSGDYVLHVGAPILRFNGLPGFDMSNAPVIIGLQQADGIRYFASSVLTRSDMPGAGPLRFAAEQSQRETTGFSTVNIDLDNITSEFAETGWDIIPFNARGGFINAAAVPEPLPVNGMLRSEIFEAGTTGAASTLPQARPLDQFLTWRDANADGVYTPADDYETGDDAAAGLAPALGNFEGLRVGPQTDSYTAFALLSNGVGVLNCVKGRYLTTTMNSLPGGYAFGFFEAGPRSGFFQHGAPLTELSVAGSGILNTADNLGWLLLTNSGADATVDGLTLPRDTGTAEPINNAIQYNRFRDGGNVRVNVISADDGLTTIPTGEAAFLHVENGN